MRKIWKALGIAALAAAAVPCKVKRDEETGAKTYQSLLSRLSIGPDEEGEGTEVRFSLLGGLIPSAVGRGKGDPIDADIEDADIEPLFEVKLERTVPADSEEAQEEDEAQETGAETEAEEPETAGETEAETEEETAGEEEVETEEEPAGEEEVETEEEPAAEEDEAPAEVPES